VEISVEISGNFPVISDKWKFSDEFPEIPSGNFQAHLIGLGNFSVLPTSIYPPCEYILLGFSGCKEWYI